jgi:hypothetical protein
MTFGGFLTILGCGVVEQALLHSNIQAVRARMNGSQTVWDSALLRGFETMHGEFFARSVAHAIDEVQAARDASQVSEMLARLREQAGLPR